MEVFSAYCFEPFVYVNESYNINRALVIFVKRKIVCKLYQLINSIYFILLQMCGQYYLRLSA